MALWQIACSFGIPTLCLGAIVSTLRAVFAVKKGLQAVLRDRLYQTYNHYTEKGYAPMYARENFENMYQQYHSLGANGVMDDLHKDFFNLPVSK